MSRRMLMTSAPAIENAGEAVARNIILPKEYVPTEKAVGDAVAWVTRALHDMAQKYVRDGWTVGEIKWDITAENIVVGQLFIERV